MIEDYMDNLTGGETASFQRISRKLLKSTFLVREMSEEARKEFYFVSRHESLFSQFFQLIGYDILVDKTAGVAMLVNQGGSGDSGKLQSNRLVLKKNESIVLCCLWTLYADRLVNGGLSQSVLVSKMDLDYELEKFQARELFDKNTLTRALELFERYHLIDVHGKVGEPDCMLRLYPSMQFCLDEKEFKTFVENTMRRMLENGKRDETDEEGEAGDESDL